MTKPDPRELSKFLKMKKLGMLPGDVDNRDPALVAIFEQDWPECYESELSKTVIMSTDDAANLEELFALWGVPMKVFDNPMAVVSRAYDVFATYGLGFQLDKFMKLTAEELRQLYSTWPVEWIEYLEAVGKADKETARKYAQKLQPLSPDCVFPYGVFVEKPPRPPNSNDSIN